MAFKTKEDAAAYMREWRAVRKTSDSYKKKNVEYVMKHYRWNRIVKEFLRIEPSVFT